MGDQGLSESDHGSLPFRYPWVSFEVYMLAEKREKTFSAMEIEVEPMVMESAWRC